MIFGEGVWGWRELGGCADRDLRLGRRVGEEGKDVAIDGSLIREDMLGSLSQRILESESLGVQCVDSPLKLLPSFDLL